MEVKKFYGTGERSTAYNDRHREWGWDCPSTDLDALEVGGGLHSGSVWSEYSNHTGRRRVYAAMEVKSAPNERINAGYGKMQLEVLLDTVRPDLPVYGVEWRTYPEIDELGDARKDWYFAVYAANAAARAQMGGMNACTMNEKTYVQLLYRLRGLDAPAPIIDRLPDEPTPRGLFFDADQNLRQPPHFKGW